MLNKKVEKELNKQLNREFHSSYLYLAMSAYLDSTGFPGAASWMRFQADEEHLHAMKFFDYILSRQGNVFLEEIEAPQAKWKSLADVFKASLAHEQFITKNINDLINVARSDKDNATENFLQWFIQEQVEEEATVTTILDKMKLLGTSGSSLYLIDQELGARKISGAAE